MEIPVEKEDFLPQWAEGGGGRWERQVAKMAYEGDCIILKGSRDSKMVFEQERIILSEERSDESGKWIEKNHYINPDTTCKLLK